MIILSCVLSLGIGIVIGFGAYQSNLFGTAIEPSPVVVAPDGSFTINGQSMDLNTLMMELSIQRSQDIDKQIADQMNTIKERNNKLKEANEIMTVMRQAKSEKKGMSEEIHNYFINNGLKETEVTIEDDNEKRNAQWDANIETVKCYIDRMNSDSQLEMI